MSSWHFLLKLKKHTLLYKHALQGIYKIFIAAIFIMTKNCKENPMAEEWIFNEQHI